MKTGDLVKEQLEFILQLNDVSDILSPADIIESKKPLVFNVLASLRNLSASLSDLQQPDFSFFNKDFMSIMLEFIAEAKKRFPTWTNFSQRELGTFLFELGAGKLDQFFYFGDQVFTNMMLPVINSYDYLLYKSFEYDYPIQGRKAAEVNVIFTLDAAHLVNIPIPYKTVISTEDGQFLFETQASVVIPAGSRSITVNAKNVTSFSASFTGLPGVKNQTFLLDQTGIVLDDVTVKVANLVWPKVSSILLASPGEKKHALRFTHDERVFVLFGDGEGYGTIPTGSIIVNYSVGGGFSANGIQSGQINKIVSGIFDTSSAPVSDIKVSNRFSPTGGQDRESLEKAKNSIASWVSTTQRSIAPSDFQKNILDVSGVLRCLVVDKPYIEEKLLGIYLDDYQVLVYIVPSTETAITPDLEQSIRDMIETERPSFGSVANNLIVANADYQDWNISGEVYFKPGSNWFNTMLLIKNALFSYFSLSSKDINGNYIINWGVELPEIAQSNIISVIERYRSFGVVKVKLTLPSVDLSVDKLKIPRLLNVDGLIAKDEQGNSLV